MRKWCCTGWRTIWRRLTNDHSKKNPQTYPTPSEPGLSYPRPFHGELLPEPFESGEGRRVSERATDPSAGRPVRLRRSICPFQADIASIVDANANRADTAPTATMRPDSRCSSTRPSEQAEDGRQGDNVSGRSSARILIYQDALRRPPVFPACKQWPDAKAGVARGRYARSLTNQNGISTRGQISRESLR
jgi:hypothetical protein